MAKLLYKLGKFIAKNKWLSVIGWLVILGVIITPLMINSPKFDSDITMNGLKSLDTNDKISKEFHLTSKFTTNELGRLQREVGKYNNFIIQYEKLSIDNEKIKIKLKSKELNEMQTKIEEVLNIKELILLDLKKTSLNDEEKNELFNELEKLFKNYKTKKKAHQLVSIIYIKLYININQNEGTNVGYFYLSNKSDDMEFKKIFEFLCITF